MFAFDRGGGGGGSGGRGLQRPMGWLNLGLWIGSIARVTSHRLIPSFPLLRTKKKMGNSLPLSLLWRRRWPKLSAGDGTKVYCPRRPERRGRYTMGYQNRQEMVPITLHFFQKNSLSPFVSSAACARAEANRPSLPPTARVDNHTKTAKAVGDGRRKGTNKQLIHLGEPGSP